MYLQPKEDSAECLTGLWSSSGKGGAMAGEQGTPEEVLWKREDLSWDLKAGGRLSLCSLGEGLSRMK